jgi:TRAP-type C4-dicarboxylate transport system substrate-binding protein
MLNCLSLRTLISLIAALGVISANGVAAKTLKFSTAMPGGTPGAAHIERMVDTINTAAQGSIEVVPYFSSQLGGENAVISQVARGRVEMGQFTVASVALQVPELALAQMPLYFDSTAQRDCVFDEHLFEPVSAILAEKNLHMIRWGEVGPLHLPGNVSFADPQSVVGAKVGIISHKINNTFWQIMGANPVPTHVAEVASSLQTGLIDTNPMANFFYVPAGINKLAPVQTKIKLWDSGGIWLMNKRLYDRLPQAAKDAINHERDVHSAAQIRQEMRAINERLEMKHRSEGGQVVELSADQRAAWRAKMGDFYSDMAAAIGPSGEAFFALIEAGKSACGNPE